MKLFFDHIPKTAGTSLRVFLSDAFGARKVVSPPGVYRLATGLSLWRDYKVIIGHFNFLPGESLPHGFISSTVIRNPLTRTLSDYYFQFFDVSENMLSPILLKLKSVPIDQAFFDPEIRKYFANYQAVHFASFFHLTPQSLPENELLQLAKRGLDQYDLIGTTERLLEFCKELQRIFDLPQNVMLKRVNVSSTRRNFSDLPLEVQKRIEEINQVDLELWRYAEHLFETKTKSFHLADKQMMRLINQDSSSTSNVCYEVPNSNIEEGVLELLEVSVRSRRGQKHTLLAGEEAVLSIAFRCYRDIDELTIGYSIYYESGIILFGINTRLIGYNLKCKAGNNYQVDFAFTVNLGIGNYFVNVSAHSGVTHLERCYLWKERVAQFTVEGFKDILFEGLVCLMPVCHIGEGLEAIDVVEQRQVVKCIGFDNPEISQISGYIRALSNIPPMRPGEQFSIMLEIKNSGKEDWICEGTKPVNIAYHWRDMDGNMIVFDGNRTPLPGRILRAGDAIRTAALVNTPEQRGRLVLELTLVQEGVCWFEQRGFETEKMEVEIK